MPKRLIFILCIVIFSQFSVFAKKHHKTTHRRHKVTHKVHHIYQPTVTLNDVKPLGNVWGIDVSHHQSDINWAMLGEQKPNFMFIKASEGISNQDVKYLENYNEAKKLGILVGSYHYFSYKSTGKEQAKNFLSIAQHKDSDLLPVLDAEFTRKMPKKELVINELADFINTIYEKLGHYPIVYCNSRYYNLYLKEKLSDKCKLWIVNYKEKPSCEWAFWQTTDRFKLQGIRGFVDLNMFNGPLANLKDMLYHTTITQQKF
ncbi:MAG: glycoside hydrolase family 25 protein [Paludibacter sp.]|nr:glycoside hydrolase family 25 protein [Paludibacter sp.]